MGDMRVLPALVVSVDVDGCGCTFRGVLLYWYTGGGLDETWRRAVCASPAVDGRGGAQPAGCVVPNPFRGGTVAEWGVCDGGDGDCACTVQSCRCTLS